MTDKKKPQSKFSPEVQARMKAHFNHFNDHFEKAAQEAHQEYLAKLEQQPNENQPKKFFSGILKQRTEEGRKVWDENFDRAAEAANQDYLANLKTKKK